MERVSRVKEFVFKRGTDLWPVGETLWHVYALPNLSQDTSLAKLVSSCRDAVRDEPITIVDPSWLHVTVAQVSDAVGRSTSADEIKELRSALQVQLQGIAPFDILVGSCLSYPSGLVFDLSPDDELNRLRDAVAEVIGRVRGPAALAFDPGVLHLTIACVRMVNDHGQRPGVRSTEPEPADAVVL